MSAPGLPTAWQGDGLFMPAWDGNSGLGVKVVTVHGANPAQGLPAVQGTYLLIDAVSGTARALLEASALTALRTGAAGGLATDVLARADAHVVALFGAGRQARTQLLAAAAVRTLTQVRLVNRSRERALAFIAEMQPFLACPITLAASADEALVGADIVIAATSAHTPVVHGHAVSSGAHITGVGSYTATMQEVDGELVRRARVVVDQRAAALAEAGDLIIPLRAGQITASHCEIELGQVLLGVAPGRQSDEEITFFKSVGLAAQDIVTATAIVQRAEERGMGLNIAL